MFSCIVFCDVSKAFDRVWHKGLLFKLRQNGIEGKLLEWLNSYLSQRKQKVGLKSCFSGLKSIFAGVPQGSVLGPLLFLVYIYFNAKVSQLLLKCYFLLFEPNVLLHDIVINKSNDLPSKQHENQNSETYNCRSSTRNVRQPKF